MVFFLSPRAFPMQTDSTDQAWPQAGPFTTSKKRIIGDGHDEASTEHDDGSKTTRLSVKTTPTRLHNTKIMRLLISQQGQKSKGFKRKLGRMTLNETMISRNVLAGHA